MLQKLKELCPSIVFSISREIDEDEIWDGDGPDPKEDGYEPYCIDVEAVAIIDGDFVEGVAYLCSSYYQDDEPIGDAHGYLPQLLKDAVIDLNKQLLGKGSEQMEAATQCEVAEVYLKSVMQERYKEQS